MGKPDVLTKDYFKDPARFADVINGFIFSGKQTILPENVHTRTESDSIITDEPNDNILTIYRDIMHNTNIAMNTAIIALENQTDVHYAMPVRVMSGDAATYHSQWRTLAKQHKDKKDLKSEEFLSGIKNGEKLIPASTIVVYFGKKPWDGPRSLKEMLAIDNLPPPLQKFIADYPLHILEVRRFEDFENFHTDFRSICGFLRHAQDADALSRYITEHKEDFTNLPRDTIQLISQYSNSSELLENIQDDTYQTDEGGVNMCKALDDLMERNLNKGIEIGTERGIKNSIHILQDYNATRDHIAELISQRFALTPERADFYVEKYWS